MIVCAGCGRPTGGQTFACCARGWCHDCYIPHLAHILEGKEPNLRDDDLSDVRIRRSPKWDAPVNSPSPWLFLVLVVAIVVVVFGALELAEWTAGRCIRCPRPAYLGGVYCRKHREWRRKRARLRTGSNPWRPGGRGRPPLEFRT